MRLKHLVNVNIVYKCPDCARSYADRWLFSRHIKIHNNMAVDLEPYAVACAPEHEVPETHADVIEAPRTFHDMDENNVENLEEGGHVLMNYEV